MDPKLKAMIFAAGVAVIGGFSFALHTPVPETRTMAELRDAGMADGQRVVLICPERITPQTRRRITRAQPGFLRPNQAYATVARVAFCFGDGGNCFFPDGSPRVGGDIVVPSLRQALPAGYDAGEGDDEDGGAEDEIDDSLQYNANECYVERCSTFDAGVTTYTTAFCSRANRLAAVTPKCAIPNCWVGDGGTWDDNAVVDCQKMEEPFGGGPKQSRWAGCNVINPGADAVGTQCVPSACTVSAGDPPDWL